jgi:hypothetical protein
MKNFLLAAVAALALGQTSVAQAAPQSLAEVAKQSRAERKTVKVFTDEDLPARSGGADSKAATLAVVPSDLSKSTEPAAAPTSKNEDAKEDTHSMSTPAAAELKKKLDSYEQERDTWKNSAKHYEDLLANETVEFRREMYQDALANDKKNIALFQEKIDQTRAELANPKKSAEHPPEHNSPESSGAQP